MALDQPCSMPGGKTLIWILIFLASTVCLDRFAFDYLIFQPANHSGWDSYRWYNFEWNFRYAEKSIASDSNYPILEVTSNSTETENKGNPGAIRIVVLGSSIARYSIQAEFLEQLLQSRLNRPVKVELISHAALMPEDAYHYASRINEMNPDLVVYPLALVDLDLEHLVPPHIPGPGFDSGAHFEFLKQRVPAQRFYPASFAIEHANRLTPTEMASGIMSGLLAGIRFSGQWWDALEFNRKAQKDSPLRSYIYYQGKPLAGGLYREGKTSGCVAFPAKYADGELTFEIPPELFSPDFKIEMEWLDADELLQVNDELIKLWQPHWEESYIYPPALLKDELLQRTMFFKDPCQVKGAILRSRHYIPDAPGWKRISLNEEERTGWIRLKLSHVVWKNSVQPVDDNNRMYGEGLRMPGQFGLEQAPVDQVQHRRWFLEDQRLTELSDLEYIEDYMERIQPENWRHRPALIPFNNLRIVKTFLPAQSFEPVYQLRRLKDVRNKLNAPMLLILNPENPVESAVFEHSQYFQDMKLYLAKEHGSGFADMHQELPMQYFADPHHFTYFGMLRMAPRYADLIQEAILNPYSEP